MRESKIAKHARARACVCVCVYSVTSTCLSHASVPHSRAIAVHTATLFLTWRKFRITAFCGQEPVNIWSTLSVIQLLTFRTVTYRHFAFPTGLAWLCFIPSPYQNGTTKCFVFHIVTRSHITVRFSLSPPSPQYVNNVRFTVSGNKYLRLVLLKG